MKNLILFTIAIGVLAHAGGTSHGGDAVRCPAEKANEKDKVYLFDYYLGSDTHSHLKIDLGGRDLNYLQKAELVVRRLAAKDPVAMEVYLQRISRWESERALLARHNIPEIDDEKSPVSTKNPCYKIQWAVQIRKPRLYEPRYYVDGELWDLADEDHRAGLVVHEVVYREPINNPYITANSEGTRIFNFLLASREVERMSQETYFHLLKQYNFLHDLTIANGNKTERLSRQVELPLAGRLIETEYYSSERLTFLGNVPWTCAAGVSCTSLVHEVHFEENSDPVLKSTITGLVETSNFRGIIQGPNLLIGTGIFDVLEGTTNTALGEFSIISDEVEALKAKKEWLPQKGNGPYSQELLDLLLNGKLKRETRGYISFEYWRAVSFGGKLIGPNIGEFSAEEINHIVLNKDRYPERLGFDSKTSRFVTSMGELLKGGIQLKKNSTTVEQIGKHFTYQSFWKWENLSGVLKMLFELHPENLTSVHLDAQKRVRGIEISAYHTWELKYLGQQKRIEGRYLIRLNEKGQIIDPEFKLPKDD